MKLQILEIRFIMCIDDIYRRSNMKGKYESPQINIINIDNEDIISTSGNEGEVEWWKI